VNSEMDILNRAVRDGFGNNDTYLYIKDPFDQGCSIPALAWIFKTSESTIANCITQAVREGH